MKRYHTKILEDLKLKRKRQAIDANIKMTEMLELVDKDFQSS